MSFPNVVGCLGMGHLLGMAYQVRPQNIYKVVSQWMSPLSNPI